MKVLQNTGWRSTFSYFNPEIGAKLSGASNRVNSTKNWETSKDIWGLQRVCSYFNQQPRRSVRLAEADLGIQRSQLAEFFGTGFIHFCADFNLFKNARSVIIKHDSSIWYIPYEKYPFRRFFSHLDHFPDKCVFHVEGTWTYIIIEVWALDTFIKLEDNEDNVM